MHRRPFRLAAATLLLSGLAGPAFAHAHLISAMPAADLSTPE